MKGKIMVVALGACLLLGVAALVALMGMQASGPPARYLPAGTRPQDLPEPDGRGAQLVVRHCRACHSVPLPSLHYAEDWPAVVADMRNRAASRVMAPLPIPTPAEERELVEYYQRHAPRPPVAGDRVEGAAAADGIRAAPADDGEGAAIAGDVAEGAPPSDVEGAAEREEQKPLP